MAKIAAVNAGYLRDMRDDRLLQTAMFLAKLDTPPDAHFGNRRHYPALVDTFLNETSNILNGALAKLYRTQKPEEAAALQWVWRAQGKPHWYTIGGASMLDFYLEFLADEEWEPPRHSGGAKRSRASAPCCAADFLASGKLIWSITRASWRRSIMKTIRGVLRAPRGKGRPLCLNWGLDADTPAEQYNRMGIGHTGRVVDFSTLPRRRLPALAADG